MIKLLIFDAGGVLHPDSDLGSSNQATFHQLTSLSPKELDRMQDHTRLNTGAISFHSLLNHISQQMRNPISKDVLLSTYLSNIQFYPKVTAMLRYVLNARHRVVLLTNNSDVGVGHTKSLLKQAGLSNITVYGSAEMKIAKPSREAFLYVCEAEKVAPETCLFIDDRDFNHHTANSLGMRSVWFKRPIDFETASDSVNECLQTLTEEIALSTVL